MGMSRAAVYQSHVDRLTTIEVEGIRLYLRSSVIEHTKTLRRMHPSRLVFSGIDVERIRKICETYYKTQYDIAPPYLLALAKKVGRL